MLILLTIHCIPKYAMKGRTADLLAIPIGAYHQIRCSQSRSSGLSHLQGSHCSAMNLLRSFLRDQRLDPKIL